MRRIGRCVRPAISPAAPGLRVPSGGAIIAGCWEKRRVDMACARRTASVTIGRSGIPILAELSQLAVTASRPSGENSARRRPRAG